MNKAVRRTGMYFHSDARGRRPAWCEHPTQAFCVARVVKAQDLWLKRGAKELTHQPEIVQVSIASLWDAPDEAERPVDPVFEPQRGVQ